MLIVHGITHFHIARLWEELLVFETVTIFQLKILHSQRKLMTISEIIKLKVQT